MNIEKIILIGVLIVLIVGSLFFIFGMNKNKYSEENFQKAIAAENPEDKCKAPAGYNDEEWKEHMSHHPEMYEGCL